MAVRFRSFEVRVPLLDGVDVRYRCDFEGVVFVSSFAALLEISPRHVIHLIPASC